MENQHKKKSKLDRMMDSKKGRIVYGIFNVAWCGILYGLFWEFFLSKPGMSTFDRVLFTAVVVLVLVINLSTAIQGKNGFGYKLSTGQLFRRKTAEEKRREEKERQRAAKKAARAAKKEDSREK